MFRVVRKKSAGAAMRRAFPTKIRGYGSTSIEFLGIPTLSRRGVARAAPRAPAPARCARRGVRWHTAARTPVASHSQPLSLRRGVGCPGGGKFTYLLTARPTPRRVCTNRRTRGAPRPDADTSSHVATCNTTWRRGRGASPPSLDRPRDGACAPRDASCMQPHSRTGFLLGWGIGPHCTV